MDKGRRLLLRLCLVVGTVFLTLVVFFYFWVHYGAELYKKQNVSKALVDRISFLELDSDLGWKNRVDFSGNWPQEDGTPSEWVRHYQIDSKGFRDHRKENQTDSGLERKIWLLGDSSPFGFGCSDEESLAALMREEFAPLKLGVENYCVTGYSTSQLAQLLEQKLEQTRPELLIVWAGFNDVEFTRGMFFESGPSKTVSFMRYKMALKEILDQGLATILVTLPHLEPSSELDQINAWIRTQESLAHVTVVDLNETFKLQNGPHLYAPIDQRLPLHFHPSEVGHHLAYRALRSSIESHLNP